MSEAADNRQMQRERMFTGVNPYEVLVAGNVLQHREAAERLARHVARVVRARPFASRLRLLDLACGATPRTVAWALAGFPDRGFEYLGVDINEDQLRRARGFEFPDNVVAADWRCGSGWDLDHLAGEGPFDVVFIGLNWHHGTPEEIELCARGIRERLAPDGLFANHDCYRPSGTPYLRRPDRCPHSGEDLRMAGSGAPIAREAPPAQEPPAWKLDAIDRLRRGYLENGGDPAGVPVLVSHSLQRDYPVSVDEVLAILSRIGFDPAAEPYDPGTLFGRHIAFVTARPARGPDA